MTTASITYHFPTDAGSETPPLLSPAPSCHPAHLASADDETASNMIQSYNRYLHAQVCDRLRAWIDTQAGASEGECGSGRGTKRARQQTLVNAELVGKEVAARGAGLLNGKMEESRGQERSSKRVAKRRRPLGHPTPPSDKVLARNAHVLDQPTHPRFRARLNSTCESSEGSTPDAFWWRQLTPSPLDTPVVPFSAESTPPSEFTFGRESKPSSRSSRSTQPVRAFSIRTTSTETTQNDCSWWRQLTPSPPGSPLLRSSPMPSSANMPKRHGMDGRDSLFLNSLARSLSNLTQATSDRSDCRSGSAEFGSLQDHGMHVLVT